MQNPRTAPPQAPLLLTHSTIVMPALVPAAPARVAASFVATEYVPPVSIALASPNHGWDGDIDTDGEWEPEYDAPEYDVDAGGMHLEYEVADDSMDVEYGHPLPGVPLPGVPLPGPPLPVAARRRRGIVAVCAALVVIAAAVAAVALWPRSERAPHPPTGADTTAATTVPTTRPPKAAPAPVRAPRPVPAPEPEVAATAPPTTAAPVAAPAPVALAEKPGPGAGPSPKPKAASPPAAATLGAR